MNAEGNLFHYSIRYGAPVASGILFALSFLYSDIFWWFSLIALIPLLFFFGNVRTPYGAFIGAWFAGSFLFGGSFLWYWNSLPLDWLGVPTVWKGILYVGISWWITTLVLSLVIGFWGSIAWYFLRTRSFLENVFFIPLAWAVLEYVRAWLYSLLTYGVGVAFGPHFTIGFLGYLLANHPLLLQFASLGKVYLLGFIVVFFNLVFFGIAAHARLAFVRKFAVMAALMAIVVGTSFVPVPEKTSGGNEITVVALHTNFPLLLSVSRKVQQIRDGTYRELMLRAAREASSPDVILLPEDTRFFKNLLLRQEADAFVQETFGALRPLIVDSGNVIGSGDKTHSRLLYYDTAAGTFSTRDKVFLAPQGEYIPDLFSFIVGLFGDSTKEIEKHRTYYPGTNENAVGGNRRIIIGGLFCSEMFSEVLYGALKNEKANMLVNAASHSWFHGSRFFYREFLAAAKVRAVENRLPLVVAANVSPAFAVNAYGRLIGETGWGKPDVLIVKIPLKYGGIW